jgi:PII-like signaling protein
MISVIDTAPKIEEAAAAIENMLDDGLIVTSDVEMVRLVRNRTVTEVEDVTGTNR